MKRPQRYTENNSSRDWIDEFCATSSVEEVRGAFRFTIGKYLRRYGKKDDPLQEAIKIQDYANRLVAFEREQRSSDHLENRRHPMTPNVIEPAYSYGCLVCGKHGGHGGLQCPNVGTVTAVSAIEPASQIDDDSPRMQAIAQNGNDGLAYSELDRLRDAADFNDDLPA